MCVRARVCARVCVDLQVFVPNRVQFDGKITHNRYHHYYSLAF